MQIRVNVVGSSGCGKSTFAKKLAARLGLPYIEMDALFWEPGWSEPADSVFLSRVAEAISRHPSWVLDGNYSRTQPLKWKNATHVVWLDYSFGRVLFQSVRSAIRRSLSQEELWPGTGNRECPVS